MEKTYKYRFSRRAIYWTLVYLVVFVLLGWLLYHLYEGGYLSAWFTSFIVALIARCRYRSPAGSWSPTRRSRCAACWTSPKSAATKSPRYAGSTLGG